MQLEKYRVQRVALFRCVCEFFYIDEAEKILFLPSDVYPISFVGISDLYPICEVEAESVERAHYNLIARVV